MLDDFLFSMSSGWRDDKPFDSTGSTSWPYHLRKFLRFHLYKENKDTQEPLGVIGKMVGVQPRSFGFAGTKNKRAITTQQLCEGGPYFWSTQREPLCNYFEFLCLFSQTSMEVAG